MQVIATAGHVDHGKSALVRALTGMEPDRWAEERRRGMTIDLGFAWMDLPGGERLAFVDVPGHERFVPNMLAGVGPAPAVLLVVAADDGWMPQSAEHLAAIDAVGIRHGLLAVTRSDLADPGPATRQALSKVAGTSLGTVEAVAVSAVTGSGLPELRFALARLVSRLPSPSADAPVRLWVDRSFTIRGSGTVVTGTLPAGTVRTGQELLLTPSMRPVRIRGLESLNEPAASVSGVARVALNLRGLAADVPARGMALVEEGRWTMTRLADVRLSLPAGLRLPAEMSLHIGSARTLARIRPLGPAAAVGPGHPGAAVGPGHPGAAVGPGDPGRAGRAAAIARLTLRDPIPLHIGDRVLLRDPGSAGLAIVGATVLDVTPPPLSGRGAAAEAGRDLAAWPEIPSVGNLLRRHGLLRASTLEGMGCPHNAPDPSSHAADPPTHAAERLYHVAGGWLVDPGRWSELSRQLADAVAAHARRDPLAIGMTPEAARTALHLPDRALVEALAREPAVPGVHPRVELSGGYLRLATDDETPAQPAQKPQGPSKPSESRESRPSREPQPSLPAHVLAAVRAVLADLAREPFMAPEAGRLRELGLDPRAIAAAARAGLLLRVTEQIVLAPDAETRAARLLAKLAQPFTAAEARQVLGTTRRVAIPLLEHLDRAGVTQRLPDDRRRLRLGSPGQRNLSTDYSGGRLSRSPTTWGKVRGPCGPYPPRSKELSPRFVRRPAALIGALALAAGVAGAAAAAPAARASITPACAWQSLYLLNGWQSAQSNWNTGDPEYCVDNGIVYLSGSLKDPTNGSNEFAVLPPQALPTSRLDLLTYTYGGTIGQLIIGPDGAMYAGGNDAVQYTSLAGVSFPVAGTALTPLPLYPGWHSGQAQYGAGNPGYVITDGIVHWTGSLTTTNTPNTGYPGNYFAPVPSGVDAGRCLNATVYTLNDHVGNMAIWPHSTVYNSRDMFVSDTPGGMTSYYASFTSLAGISYPAGGTANWQPLSLSSGWSEVTPSSYCQYYPSTPSYYVQGHVAYLIGWIQQNQAGDEFIGTLPLAARPVHDLYMIVGPTAYLHISPNGPARRRLSSRKGRRWLLRLL